ncbi:MAG: hypothetical protein WCD75_02725, partial [Rhodoplanes sp.]
AKALATGRRRGNGGLAPRTVGQMHAILKSALAQAVKWEILIRNPAAAQRRQCRATDLEQVLHGLEVRRGDDWRHGNLDHLGVWLAFARLPELRIEAVAADVRRAVSTLWTAP